MARHVQAAQQPRHTHPVSTPSYRCQMRGCHYENTAKALARAQRRREAVAPEALEGRGGVTGAATSDVLALAVYCAPAGPGHTRVCRHGAQARGAAPVMRMPPMRPSMRTRRQASTLCVHVKPFARMGTTLPYPVGALTHCHIPCGRAPRQ